MGARCCAPPASWPQLSISEDAQALWATAQESAESFTIQISQASADFSRPPALASVGHHFSARHLCCGQPVLDNRCNSCQAGPVAVKGKTEPEKSHTKCLLKHWTQPGSHYGIGCLPLPESTKTRSARVFLVSSAGRLLSMSACQVAAPKWLQPQRSSAIFLFATFAMSGTCNVRLMHTLRCTLL